MQIANREYLANILEQSRMAGEMQFIVALSVQLTEELLIQVSEYYRRLFTFGVAENHILTERLQAKETTVCWKQQLRNFDRVCSENELKVN